MAAAERTSVIYDFRALKRGDSFDIKWRLLRELP
jgi:hypothetical protein